MENQNLFCVVKPITMAQKPTDLIKTASQKRFVWWSTTTHGKKAIAEHKLLVFSNKREALAEAQRRLKKMLSEKNAYDSMTDPFKQVKVGATGVDPADMELPDDDRKAMKDRRTKQAYSMCPEEFKVPQTIISSLEKKIKTMNELLDQQMELEPNWCQYYMTAVGAMQELLAYLKDGSIEAFKRAVLKMYSFSNLIYLEIPDDVVKFLHGTGQTPKLQDYYYKEVQKKEEERWKEPVTDETIVEPEKSKAPK